MHTLIFSSNYTRGMSQFPQKAPVMTLLAPRLMVTNTILLLSLSITSFAQANTQPAVAGIIDAPTPLNLALSLKQLKKQVKKEQKTLAKESREKLKKRADKGERLAQVVLGGIFASEAQMLTFAPNAANDALSDALALYSLAAKRGYPGAPSLDQTGVNFYPVRVVRNK